LRGWYSRPCSIVTSLTSRSVSASVRRKVVVRSTGLIRCRVIALARENSRSPSAPWIRPNPDSPTPPNGSAGTATNDITELTEVIPARRARAARTPARRPRVNTADPSAYRDALASRTASASDATGVTVTTGPKVSSRTAALSSGTSTRMTGAM
jgi:hypothetical protein